MDAPCNKWKLLPAGVGNVDANVQQVLPRPPSHKLKPKPGLVPQEMDGTGYWDRKLHKRAAEHHQELAKKAEQDMPTLVECEVHMVDGREVIVNFQKGKVEKDQQDRQYDSAYGYPKATMFWLR